MKNLYLPSIVISFFMFSCNSSTGDRTSKNSADTIVVVPAAKDTTTTVSDTTAAITDTVKITKHYHNITILRTMDASFGAELKDEYEYKDSNLIAKTDKWYDQVATFGTAERIWLAPKGWTGDGCLYTNGGVLVKFYPHGGSDTTGPRIRFLSEESPASVNYHAAPFFPNAMEEHDEAYDYLDVEKLPQGTKLKRISPKLIAYTMPAEGGLIRQGVVFYGTYDPDEDPYFREVRIMLPADQSALMDYLIKWYMKKLK